MKQEIEKKLGCSIEQFMEEKHKKWQWADDNDMDVDGPTGLEALSVEEVLFMAGYVEHLYGGEARISA